MSKIEEWPYCHKKCDKTSLNIHRTDKEAFKVCNLHNEECEAFAKGDSEYFATKVRIDIDEL